MRGGVVFVGLLVALLAGCAERDVGRSDHGSPAIDERQPVEDPELGFRWTFRRASGEARPPTKPFGTVDGTTLQWLVDSDHRPGSGDLAVVGAFGSSDEATRALARVRRRFAALAAHSGGAGMGRHAGATEAVVRLGPLVVVRGLRAGWQADAAEEMLADAGADGVFREDRGSAPDFVVDLSCRPTRIGDAAVLAQDLIDFGSSVAQTLRPPWVAPALTDRERLARSTLLRAHRARLAVMRSDPVAEALADVYLASARNNRAAEERARARLDVLLDEAAPTRLEEPYDARVLAAYGRTLEDEGRSSHDLVARKVEPMLGQLPVDRRGGETLLTSEGEYDAGDLDGARLDERLDIAGFRTGAFVPGLARLLVLLDGVGCEDVRVALIRR